MLEIHDDYFDRNRALELNEDQVQLNFRFIIYLNTYLSDKFKTNALMLDFRTSFFKLYIHLKH